jgi:hypothetical protein
MSSKKNSDSYGKREAVSTRIHGQCFHQQVKAGTLVGKNFMWMIRAHAAKLNLKSNS